MMIYILSMGIGSDKCSDWKDQSVSQSGTKETY